MLLRNLDVVDVARDMLCSNIALDIYFGEIPTHFSLEHQDREHGTR
jgi:hypothetical protein